MALHLASLVRVRSRVRARAAGVRVRAPRAPSED